MGYIASTRSSIHEPRRVGLETPGVQGLTRDIPGRSRMTSPDVMVSILGSTFFDRIMSSMTIKITYPNMIQKIEIRYAA